MKDFKSVKAFAIIIITMYGFLSCQHSRKGTIFSDQNIEGKTDSLLSVMTPEEKIGQMTLFASGWDVTGPTMRDEYRNDIKAGKAGAVFNAVGVKYTRELQQLAVDSTRLGIPLLFGYDVLHGYKTIFPIPLGEAASWNLVAIERSARIAAIEATAEGLNWTFAPMVDIARDPRWGRIAEGAGEDTYLGCKIAEARVKGFQNNDLMSANTMVACAKHFAAYGAAQAGRDYHTADLSEITLREVYLQPFHAALKAGAGTIMTSFNELNGIPSSGNKYLLTNILKEEWGFEGFVVTDFTSINEMVPHGIAANEKEAAKLAVNAGVDMDMQGAVFYNYLNDLLHEDQVKIQRIDDAVRRILSIKFALGLFEDPYRYCDEQRAKELVMSEEHLAFAQKIARESIVLLKNEENILPLNKNISRIAVVGPLADSRRDLMGTWAAAGDSSHCTTVLEGIRQKVASETTILYADNFDYTSGTGQSLQSIADFARQADVIIAVVGEKYWMSGEAASRSEIGLPFPQEELVRKLYNSGKPVVVVLMNGRPLAIPWLDEHIPAILETWFLGTKAGDAIADVLFGDYNPSGKLPVTFPRSVGQIPLFYNAKNTGRPISESKYTSKYLDIPNTPLYPLGYGLSYTTYAYSDISLNKKIINSDDTLIAAIGVTNTGNVDGEEVVQLYIRDLAGSLTRPVLELKGFEKIFIHSGETKRVEFKLTIDDLKFYNADMEFLAEPGEFRLFIGTNSQDTKQASFVLK